MNITMAVDTAVTVPLNLMPLTDDGDFKTRETGVAYNQAGLDLVWNFVTPAGVITQTAVTPTDTAGVYDWTHVGDGMYKIEIPASGGGTINNDTEGYGYFTGFATGVLPWRGPTIAFVPAHVVNGLVTGSDNLQVDTIQIVGGGQSATDLKDFADDGYDPSTNKVTGLLLADAVTTVNGLANNVITTASIADGAYTAAKFAAAFFTTIWDKATSALTAVGSIGKLLVDNIDATISSRLASVSYTAPANSDIAAIKAVTDGINAQFMDVDSALVVIENQTDDIATIQTVTDKLSDTLEDSGGGNWIFTTPALANAPTGGSAPTADEIANEVLEELIAEHSGVAGSLAAIVSGINSKTTNLPVSPAATGAQMDLVNAPNATAVTAIQSGLATAAAVAALPQDNTSCTLADSEDVYHADIDLSIDEANTQDEWTITWFRNGVRQTSGITLPTIQVVKRTDGSNLIASTTPSEIASTGSYKHDATTTARTTAGEAVLVIVAATINGSSRTFARVLSRDSAS